MAGLISFWLGAGFAENTRDCLGPFRREGVEPGDVSIGRYRAEESPMSDLGAADSDLAAIGSAGRGREGAARMHEQKQIQFPIGHGADRAYRLSRCRGFLVVASEGRKIGRVSELHYHTRLDQPDEMVVQGGLFRMQRLVYPADAVAEIVWRERRLVLTPDAKPVAGSRLNPSTAT